MSIVGYQSTPIGIPNGGGNTENSQTEIALAYQYINPQMLHSPGRNIIAVINDNIVIGKDIRIRSRRGQKEVAGWQISLPAPINKNQQGEHTGTLLSRQGNPFYYAIDDDGRVFVSGEFEDEQDEIIFNINPYVAELPLKFRPFGGVAFELPPDELPDIPRPVPDDRLLREEVVTEVIETLQEERRRARRTRNDASE